MTSATSTSPTAAELIPELREHLGVEDLDAQSLERDVLIWICRTWTKDTARVIAAAMEVAHQTVLRAEERISKELAEDEHAPQRTPLRLCIRQAEDYMVAQASRFAMSEEAAEFAGAWEPEA